MTPDDPASQSILGHKPWNLALAESSILGLICVSTASLVACMSPQKHERLSFQTCFEDYFQTDKTETISVKEVVFRWPKFRSPRATLLTCWLTSYPASLSIKATQTTPRKPTKGGVAAFSVNMSGAAAAAKLEWEAGKGNPPSRM